MLNTRKSKKWALIFAASLLTLFVARKEFAYNYMSHESEHESSLKLNPLYFFSKGNYNGFITNPETKQSFDFGIDLNRIYLGFGKNTLPVSKYKPTSFFNANNITFYSIMDYYRPRENPDMPLKKHFTTRLGAHLMSEEGIEKILNMNSGDIFAYEKIYPKNITSTRIERTLKDGSIITKEYSNSLNQSADGHSYVSNEPIFSLVDLEHFKISIGMDDAGKRYLSVFDAWDFEPKGGVMSFPRLANKIGSLVLPFLGEPIYFYDRFYLDDFGMSEKVLRKELDERKSDNSDKLLQ